MKKITLFILLLTLPFVASAQTWDFNALDGWSSNGGTQGTSALDGLGYLVNSFAGTSNTVPGIIKFDAAIDADANKYVHITIQNQSDMTFLVLRIKQIADPTKYIYTTLGITSNDSGYITYEFDMTGVSDWTGTVDELYFYVKPATGNNGTAGLTGNVNYDSIVIDSNPPVIPPVVFDFAAGAEGWFVPATQGVLTTPAGSIVNTFPGTATVPGIKNNTSLSIDANALKYCHITMTNNSAMTALVLRFTTGSTPANSYNTMAMTANASGVYTYDFSALGLWQGTITDIDIYVKPDATQNNSTLQLSGNLDFDQIVFSQDAVLAVEKVNFKDDVNITLYPNPVSNILTINSPNRIEKIEVFNMLGQASLSQKGVSKTLDASSLSNGMYILKIHQEGDIISTKRFIKQ